MRTTRQLREITVSFLIEDDDHEELLFRQHLFTSMSGYRAQVLFSRVHNPARYPVFRVKPHTLLQVGIIAKKFGCSDFPHVVETESMTYIVPYMNKTLDFDYTFRPDPPIRFDGRMEIIEQRRWGSSDGMEFTIGYGTMTDTVVYNIIK